MDILINDLLVMLDIPCINLEEFSCPKVEELVHIGFGYKVWDCRHHQISGGVHCLTMEWQILLESIGFTVLRALPLTLEKIFD